MQLSMLERRQFLTFTPSRQPTADGFWLHVSRTAMACRFEITLPLSARNGVTAAQLALEEAGHLEEQLSIFRENSEVSRLNRSAGTAPVHVERSLFDLLRLSQQLFRETEGAFDITSGPLSQCWGFLRRQGRIPDSNELEMARSLAGGHNVILDDLCSTVQFERNGVGINFGSIGKGYALDRIAGLLSGSVSTALVSAGSSSMRAIGSGAAGQDGWSVGIRHPLDKARRIAVLQLRDAALATSGHEEQFFEHEGRRYGHIIDPRTGWPAEGVDGVTVVARSAAVADALATAFYVGGSGLARTYCAAHPQVLVILLEAGAASPTVIGESNNCEVEMINE